MDLDHPGGTRPIIAVSPEARARARAYCERGLAHYGRGDVEDAVRLWLAARAEDPTNARVQRYLEHAHEVDGVDLEAITPAGAELLARETAPIPPPRPLREPEYIENPPLHLTPAGWTTTVEAEPPIVASAALVTAELRGADGEPGPGDAGPAEVEQPAVVDTTYRPRPATAPLPGAPQADLEAALTEIRDRLGADDFSGAIEAADAVLARAPENAEALAAKAGATAALMRHHESKLGDLRAVPTLRIPADEVIWLNLNHREGFLLSQIDGSMTYEDILDVCGMPRLDALRVLANLVNDKVIGAAPAPAAPHASDHAASEAGRAPKR